MVMTEHTTREEMLAFEETEEAKMGKAIMEQINNAPHYKEVVPSDGLSAVTKEFISDPDGNTIKIQYIRPDNNETLPCVYYIHGGGMEISSCFDEMYQAWGRCIARQGVAVAMVDFRNARWPSSAEEIAPYPAGLNDCVSGIKWVHSNSSELNIDPNKIIIAKPITKGGVIIGRTDNILIVFLNLKLVLAIKRAKAKPKTVDENAVSVPIVTVFQKTPQA